MFQCYHCGNENNSEFVGRQDTCDKCGRNLRCCLNCKHFDKSSNNECREEQAQRHVDKEKGNFCEWFGILTGKRNGLNTAPGATDLRKAADALFKKKS